MQHQYWVTKKSVLRKLGGKEDDCVVSSDAELDAKLELFKSINESCSKLQRVIDLYQERLCYLAQEENALGRYLKECAKTEKNKNAEQIMSTAGKALAYTGHQRLTIRPSLLRLHHEVDTFRGRAITDTKATVSQMEKTRTEYRAALSWMKSASLQLDPDTGHGLERFRKTQLFVKTAKIKFDNFTLACLQKVDLLAAARCNMFSHVLLLYQSSVELFSSKAAEILNAAAEKLGNTQVLEFNTVSELGSPSESDKDKYTFFNTEYTDMSKEEGLVPPSILRNDTQPVEASNLLDEDFASSKALLQEENFKADDTPSSALVDLKWTNSYFLAGDFLPSKLLQENSFNFNTDLNKEDVIKADKPPEKSLESNENRVAWLKLFAELDPLANSPIENNTGDTV